MVVLAGMDVVAGVVADVAVGEWSFACLLALVFLLRVLMGGFTLDAERNNERFE